MMTLSLKWCAFLCIVAATALKAVYVAVYVRHGKKRGSSACRVPDWLPFGIDLTLRCLYHLANNTFCEWSTSLLDKYGRTVELNMLGGKFIFTDDARNIRAIMSTQFSDFPKGEIVRKVFANSLGDAIVISDGEQWHAGKRRLSQHFGQMGPKQLEDTEQHFQAMIEVLEKGTTVDVYDLIERYQVDITCANFLGKAPDYVRSGKAPFRDALAALLMVNTCKMTLGPAGGYIPDSICCPGASKGLEDFLGSFIDEILALPVTVINQKPPAERNLIEKLVLQGLSRKDLRNDLVSIFLTAKPNAILISWAIYELARHPEVMKQLREEVISAIGTKRCPTLSELQNLKRLRWIVNETMRMYHPLALNTRVPPRQTSLPTGGGINGDQPVHVPAGTHVMYSVGSLQRREDTAGSKPNEWRPQRWEHWEPSLWGFIPFNHGPRICLGRKFGRFQVEYVLARLAQEFESIELHEKDGFQQRIKMEVNTQMAYPVHCSFHKGTG